MPRDKEYTVEELEETFNKYVTAVKKKPFLVKDWVGKDGDQVFREKEKPLTMEGFRVFAFKLKGCIKHYFDNRDSAYNEYGTICSHIKDIIRQDQIEGGMAGMYNPSITQRLNGLVEKSENKTEHTGIIKADFGTTNRVIHPTSESKTDT